MRLSGRSKEGAGMFTLGGPKTAPRALQGPFLPYSRPPSCSAFRSQSLNSWDGSTGTVMWPSLNRSGGGGQSHHFRMVLGSRPVSRRQSALENLVAQPGEKKEKEYLTREDFAGICADIREQARDEVVRILGIALAGVSGSELE